MLWSLIKIFIFIGLAAALAIGAGYLLEMPGEVRMAFGNREFYLSPLGFLIGLILLFAAVFVVMKLLGLLVAVVRFLMGDETAISRFFSRNRERRGYDALSEGMVALASGDPRLAAKKAVKAEKLLNRPDITGLIAAQAAEMSGDKAGALASYKAMLADPRTRFVAVQGLMKQQLDEGDTYTALELAKKAFALKPANPTILRTLFDLQARKEDWAGARGTLNAATQARLLPRDVGTRRDAVLSLADARASIARGETMRGNEAALQANRLAPTLVPAAALAAQVHVEKGSKRKAVNVLTTAWSANPHPDLAAAFAAIEPEESPAARRKRFNTLVAVKPGDPESHLLLAELALSAEDFPGARKALGSLAETLPTTRSLAIMAAVERGQGAPEAVVRGWLAKALNASRGPQWICGKCNHVHAAWMPICESCGAFDTLEWKSAPHAENASLSQSAMLPLIIGQPEAPVAESKPDRVIEEAEIAGEPVKV